MRALQLLLLLAALPAATLAWPEHAATQEHLEGAAEAARQGRVSCGTRMPVCLLRRTAVSAQRLPWPVYVALE